MCTLARRFECVLRAGCRPSDVDSFLPGTGVESRRIHCYSRKSAPSLKWASEIECATSATHQQLPSSTRMARHPPASPEHSQLATSAPVMGLTCLKDSQVRAMSTHCLHNPVWRRRKRQVAQAWEPCQHVLHHVCFHLPLEKQE